MSLYEKNAEDYTGGGGGGVAPPWKIGGFRLHKVVSKPTVVHSIMLRMYSIHRLLCAAD